MANDTSSGRPNQTVVDYVTIVLSPALIMGLVGSLVFFLLEVFYRTDGEWKERLQYILFFYVFGAVLTARVAMNGETAARAPLYGAVLAVLTFFGMQLFVEYPPGVKELSFLVNILLVGVVWWCTQRLTWDCTNVDEDTDMSGEGLLQAAGLEEKPEPDAEVLVEDPQEKKTVPAVTTWIERWQRYRERKQKKRTLGVWVVYFLPMMAALPIFGLGQSLIPLTAPNRRQFAFWLMIVYVGCGLGLLLTTCFLGLRRYLRQKRLQMPAAMTGVWLTTGGTLIVLLLLVGAFLPRPYAEYHPLQSLFHPAGSGKRSANQVAMKGDSPGEGKGQAGEPQGDGKTPGDRTGKKGKGEGQGKDSGGNDGKDGENKGDRSGDNKGEKGGDGKGEQGKGEQGKGEQEKGEKGKEGEKEKGEEGDKLVKSSGNPAGAAIRAMPAKGMEEHGEGGPRTSQASLPPRGCPRCSRSCSGWHRYSSGSFSRSWPWSCWGRFFEADWGSWPTSPTGRNACWRRGVTSVPACSDARRRKRPAAPRTTSRHPRERRRSRSVPSPTRSIMERPGKCRRGSWCVTRSRHWRHGRAIATWPGATTRQHWSLRAGWARKCRRWNRKQGNWRTCTRGRSIAGRSYRRTQPRYWNCFGSSLSAWWKRHCRHRLVGSGRIEVRCLVLECGSALLCRFGLAASGCFSRRSARKETRREQNSKRQSKALPHSKGKTEEKTVPASEIAPLRRPVKVVFS